MTTDAPGVTAYDAGFPVIGAPLFKGTDADLVAEPTDGDYVRWVDLDYEIGGGTGAANRNAYVLNGVPVTFDAHDFRGDHAHIPAHYPYGNYGDVGNTDDYASQYAQGIAANAYPDLTTEESWDRVSAGI